MASSILTNRSAMTALQTLRGIDNNLDRSKDRISTGLRIGNASDNAAYWSISSMMKHDSNTMSAVVDAMNLGKEQVSIAATAVDVTKQSLDDIQKSMVSAREKSNDDITKIQDSIKGNMQNISNAIQSAAFGGKNVLSNGGQKVGIAAGYRREGSAVYVDMIEVGGAELNFGVMKPDGTIDLTGGILQNVFGTSEKGLEDGLKVFNEAAEKQKGLEDALAKAEADYAANASEENKTALDEAKKAVEDNKEDWTKAQSDFKVIADAITLADFVGLEGIADLPSVAQEMIFSGVQKTIRRAVDLTLTAGSKIGSAVNMVDNQLNFVKKLLDNIDAGVGALIDADMNAESAKLSALQVQQQLGIQALSIANQGSQNILALFRN
ncbi:flagellin [Bartonella ancashensis]|uniref:Flagellin n=1 Tax=Bartonella ancashensis TaxID=1318743 RepID=A0A0M4L825_9HYPH|nr:flagellin [Bartonella ancashensis]ALE03538.1 Flagellin protein FlaA [Bartonella ancashensis]